MVRLFPIAVVLIALAFSWTNSASASLDISDPEFLGWVDPGTPANANDEVHYISKLIDASFINITPPTNTAEEIYGPGKIRDYSREDSSLIASFAEPTVDGGTQGIEDQSSFDLNTLYQYVLGKYGSRSYVWYFKDGISEFDLLLTQENGNGLSHVSYYNAKAIPEAGSILVWSCLGLASAFMSRRRRTS